MKYSLKEITLITKFEVGSFSKYEKNNLSGIFWKIILNKKTFHKFVIQKYIPFKKSNNTLTKAILTDINFIISKIDSLKSSFNTPLKKDFYAIDIFFTYLIFRRIVTIYNEFYFENSKIRLSLVLGIEFVLNKTKKPIEIFEDIKKIFSSKNDFIDETLLPIFENKIEENKLYILEISLPNEIIEAMIFGNIIKNKTKNSKILLDLSLIKEKQDFLTWISFIKENGEFFAKYLDFFVFEKKSNSYNNLLDFLNGNLLVNLENIIFIEKFELNLEKLNFKPSLKLEEKIDPKELLPWLLDKEYVKPKKFFDFLDNSGLFNILQISTKNNPFKEYLKINEKISGDFETILNSYFFVSKYLKVEDENSREVIFFDIVNFSYYYLPKENYNFIKNYNFKITLGENILNNFSFRNNDFILDLIRNKILIFIK